MILVDSSVWIDYFNGKRTRQTDALDALLAIEPVALGDLILTEVLQGFASQRDFRLARDLLTSLTIFDMGGKQIALQAAQNFRTLRKLGITIRKTIDCVIATFCLERNHQLLYSDRDFDPFVTNFGLQSVA